MISFLHPWALAGLVAAGLPLLLHLLARREPPTVVFPAVRYLVDATRRHQRRLRLQNLLLLVLRTLLVVALVLAAAGPLASLGGVGLLGAAPGHAPTALVLVVDNSLSSGAVVAGTPRLAALRRAAREVLDRASADDELWLIAADGVPRRGTGRSLAVAVDSLEPSPRRLDLGEALATAGDLLAASERPGEIVVLSDLQASALSAAEIRVPLLVARPGEEPPPNRGIAALATSPQPWTIDGGRVVVTVAGDSGGPLPLSIRLGEGGRRSTLVRVGVPTAVGIPGAASGWWRLTAELNPDELRGDDVRIGAVRVAPIARVRWDSTDTYVAAAAEVLAANGRIARGSEVVLGGLGPGRSIVVPPADRARLGALNRELAARRVAWRYGDPLAGGVTTDSGPLVGRERVMRRHRLVRVGGETGAAGAGVLATAGGEPWIVRDGDVVLLASRLEPEWTGLPVAAGFMPFIDALVNVAARGDVAVVQAAPGVPVALPDPVTEVRRGTDRWPVEGGAAYRPPLPGLYFLLGGPDTVGALAVNPDPRESLLAPAPDDAVRRLWRGARVVELSDAAAYAFAQGTMADLRGPLLWAALVLGVMEVGLASVWRRRG